MTIPLRSSAPVVLITDADRQIALRFARSQPNPEKARQVYRNTLAVLTTQHCLDLLEIPTDLATSDCWNPFCRLAADVADLPVTGLGSLECRPVSPDQQSCLISSEVFGDRIGYLVVQLDSAYREATILGFAPEMHQGSLVVNKLHPLEELLIHLEWLKAQQSAATSITSLSQWFDDHQGLTNNQGLDATRENTLPQIPHGDRIWQSFKGLLGSQSTPAFAFRAFQTRDLNLPEDLQLLVEQLYASQRFGLSSPAIQPAPDLQAALVHLIQTTTDEEVRWKAAEILWTIEPGHPATGVRRVLDLGLLLGGQPIVLLVAILQSSDESRVGLEPRRFSVLARVLPKAESGYLPTGLQLAVLSAGDTAELEVQSRERDNYIQLKLRGDVGERFGLQLRLEQDQITEYFVI